MALPLLLLVPLIATGVTAIAGSVYHTVSNWNDPNGVNRKRRGVDDYQTTSSSIQTGARQGMTPMQPMQGMTGLEGITLNALQPLTAMKPMYPMKGLTVDTHKGGYSTMNINAEFSSLTDPLQVNSIGDVLLNQEGKDIIMEDLGLDNTILNFPGLKEITVGVDMLINKYAAPILQGDFATAGLNALNGLGEDLDTLDFANLVKGMVLEKDKGKAFSRALGIGNEGKYQYNYNTGNGLKDFGLEMISSPGFVVSAVKGITAAGIKNASKAVGKEAFEKAALQTGTDLSAVDLKSITRRAGSVAGRGLVEGTNSDVAIKGLLYDFTISNIDKVKPGFSEAFQTNFKQGLLDKISKKSVKAVQVLKKVDEAEDAMSAYVLKTYLTAGTYPVLKKPVDNVLKALRSRTIKRLEPLIAKGVDVANGVFSKEDSIFDLTKVMDGTLLSKLEADEIADVKKARTGLYEDLSDMGAFTEERILNVLKDVDTTRTPYEIYNDVIAKLETDLGKAEIVVEKDVADLERLKKSISFKEYLIGKGDQVGYLLDSANKLKGLKDALGGNFLRYNKVLLKQLEHASTNQDALDVFSRFFKKQGSSLEDTLLALRKATVAPDVSAFNQGGKAYLDETKLISAFNEKAWTNPRVLSDGSMATAFAEDSFKTYEDYRKFVVAHEYAHNTVLIDLSKETRGMYEDRVNRAALEYVQNGGPNRSFVSVLKMQQDFLQGMLDYTGLSDALLKKLTKEQFAEVLALPFRKNFIGKVSRDPVKLTKGLDLVNDISTKKFLADALPKGIVKNVIDDIDPHILDEMITQSNAAFENAKEYVSSLGVYKVGPPLKGYLDKFMNLRTINKGNFVSTMGSVSTTIDQLMYAFDHLAYTGPLAPALQETINALNGVYIDLYADVYRKNPASIVYALQSEKSNVRAQILNTFADTVTEQGRSLLDTILDISENNDTVFGTVLNEISHLPDSQDPMVSRMKRQASMIVNRAKATSNYVKLVSALDSLDADGLMKNDLTKALLDGLENFSDMKPEGVANIITPEEIEKILDTRIDQYKRSGILKLENIYEDRVAKSPRYINEPKLVAHDAVGDATMGARLFQQQLDTGVLKATEWNGKTIVVFDLETTGLNLNAAKYGDAEVVQIAAHKHIIVNGEIGEPIEVYERYNLPTDKVNKLETSRVLPAEVKAKAKKAVADEVGAINEFKVFQGDATLIGHNIKNYDIPFLNCKTGLFNADNSLDTLEVLKSTDEFKSSLYSAEKAEAFSNYTEQAYKLIQDYTTIQKEIDMPFIHTVDWHFNEDLHYLASNMEYGLSPQGSTFLKTYSDTSNILFSSLKRKNEELMQYYMTPESIARELGTSNAMVYLTGMKDGKFVDGFMSNEVSARKISGIEHLGIFNNIPENQSLVPSAHLEKAQRIVDTNYSWLHVNPAYYNDSDLYTMRKILVQDYGDSNLMQFVDLDKSSIFEMMALYKSMKYFEPGEKQGLSIFNDLCRADALSKSLDIVENGEQIIADAEILRSTEVKTLDYTLAFDRMLARGSNADLDLLFTSLDTEWSRYVDDPEKLSDLMRAELSTHRSYLEPVRRLVDAQKALTPAGQKVMKILEQRVYHNQTLSILTLNPEQLAKFMYQESTHSQVLGADLIKYENEINMLMQNKESLNALGIGLDLDEHSFTISQLEGYEEVLKANAEKTTMSYNYHEQIDREVLPPEIRAVYDAYEETYNRNQALTELNNGLDAFNDGASVLDTGEYYRSVDTLPANVRKNMVGKDAQQSFLNRYNHNDYTILGGADARKTYRADAGTSPVFAQIKNIQRRLQSNNARLTLLQTLTDPRFTLKNKELWDARSDAELYALLSKNDQLSVVVLHSKDGKTMLRKVRPNSMNQMTDLRNLNGMIMPTDLANSISGSVNEYGKMMKENHPLLSKWREYVIGTYKNIFLSTIGFPFRNALDMVTKNVATGKLTLPETIGYNIQGWKAWTEYSKNIAAIMGANDGSLTRRGIDNFFLANPQINKEMFEFVHEYATSSISGGMAVTQEKAVKAYNFAKTGVKPNFYQEHVLGNKVTGMVMGVNSHLEHGARLGLLIGSLDDGVGKNEAIQRVLKAHFDYSNVSYQELMAECIIPFITFPLRNLEYWADAVKGNMWMVRAFTDATMETNQMQEQTQQTLDTNTLLRNNLLSGNVNVFDNIIKTNPSMFDAAKLIMNPISVDKDGNFSGELWNRLAPPVKNLVIGVKQLPHIYREIVDRNPIPATLVRGIDGDTAVFMVNGKEKTVRMLGINTAESVKPGVEVQAGSLEASAYAKERLANAKDIQLKYDPNTSRKDAYDRDLMYVYVDGSLLQLDIIAEGHSVENPVITKPYNKETSVNRNVTKLDQFLGNWGLYNFTRTKDMVAAGVKTLMGSDNYGNMLNKLPDEVRKEFEVDTSTISTSLHNPIGARKPGSFTGEMSIFTRLADGSTLEQVSGKILPKKAEKEYKQDKENRTVWMSKTVAPTIKVGHSTQRVPAVKAYYNPTSRGTTSTSGSLPVTPEVLTKAIGRISYSSPENPQSIYNR